MKLIFATHNQHKVQEIKKLVPLNISILSLNDINCHNEIGETGTTLEENAKIKAEYIKYKYGLNCFADDSGLEIEALGGAPGVFSARYAGAEKNSENNIKKVWEALKNKNSTKAQFRTIIAASFGSKISLFEGKVIGNLIFEKRGKAGFGYDSIFIPKGYEKTFAELGDVLKNKISHRALATQKFLKELYLL
ncbi:MAG: XTP/dITP diphosphohydrolase [Flavobacteriaceae bacterium]|jgi:XTP/dITP diphosphohydrolase|tara:strand:- start:1957 stop:2532 length:576 start_codon:yes stop_codon:yes gene_type:complete